MKVLMLGPHRDRWIQYFESFGDEVMQTEEHVSGAGEGLDDYDFLISYGYRHILRRPVLERFSSRAINLHISFLPWNRGADPNLWSILEDTPKGVSIHVIDEGLDTGPVLAQTEVSLNDGDTLRTSYDRLTKEIERLFWQNWPLIRKGELVPVAQPKGGSFHYKKDFLPYQHLLTNGWDTPVRQLLGRV